MKCEILTKKEVELKYVLCSIGVRYWEDAEVNGVDDTEKGDNIPCKDGDCWNIKIDVDSGVIENWEKGKEAKTHYKSCDGNVIEFYDNQNNRLACYDGYVPDFLSPAEDGYGDYVILNIDKNGKIENWKLHLVAECLDQAIKDELDDDD